MSTRILAVRFARLGDLILLLPALARLRQAVPESNITLMTGHRFAPVAELCPYIDRVWAVDRLRMRDGSKVQAIQSIIRLVRDVRSARFDIAVDFHSFRETNLLCWASGATVRLGMKRSDRAFLPFCFNREPVLEDKSIHVSEMFMRVAAAVPGGGATTPKTGSLLIPPAEVDAQIRSLLPQGNFLTLFVGARAADHVWHPERYAALADRLVEETGMPVVLLDGPELLNGRSTISRVRNESQIGLVATPKMAELVAAIRCSQLLVSNDTGPMHLGPVLGVPTLGLFSVSHPVHYRPVYGTSRYLRARSLADISVDAVMTEVHRMLAGT